MGFPQTEADELLAQCHRRCCICHRFCGIKMELDHIIPREQNGSDTIDNAIPLCFECHAEVQDILFNETLAPFSSFSFLFLLTT
jgi:5-methylcytosine-specific restriction endonuclease McrA